MLHKDVLIRLCDARTLLRDTSEDRRSIPQIAREIGMSVFHFIRLYKAVFGETPKQCQLSARLNHAKHLLMTTDIPVTDISMEEGSPASVPLVTCLRAGSGCRLPPTVKRSAR